jgi:3-hydroxyacyl-[acyl-carrier-protein] dehydratase
MRFCLVDRIEHLELGERISAIKALSMAEEYLGDHFPGFPVMPGVLMLEAMTQTAAWLVRAGEDFAHSMVLLKEARGVKYGQFVEPGQTLRLTADIVSQNERETVVKARGTVDGRVAVQGRLTLERYDLAETNPEHAQTDSLLKEHFRALFTLLHQPTERGAEAAHPEK